MFVTTSVVKSPILDWIELLVLKILSFIYTENTENILLISKFKEVTADDSDSAKTVREVFELF
jgi:hypothetical protein